MPKAKIPARKARNSKGAPPPESRASANLSKPADGVLMPLNFKVASDFKIEYKTFAASHGMTMNKLLEASFKLYKENTK
jgi:hypothetical protein